MKSKIEKKNEIDFSKELIAKSYVPSEELIQAHMSRLVNVLPDTVTKKEIREKALAILYREAAYNEIMEYLSKQFTYKISETELQEFIDRIKANINIQSLITKGENKERNKEEQEQFNKYATDLATKVVIKGLIYEVLQKDYKIEVSDDEVRVSLKAFNEQTKKPIDEILKDPKQFEEIRSLILEDRTTEFLLDKFKVKFSNESK